MTIREMLEEREEMILSPYASLAKNSKGRDVPETECDIRPVYQRDRDRIVHCKAFRRLKDKTQVFLIPEGDHYRTRLTHTLEVSQIARTISKALRLNEDLTEAIALGHDLGHTPFGHAGERALNSVCPFRFKHNEQSVRTVEKLERDGNGLNLTWEVRNGILNHQISCTPATLEGKVVRLSDKIAYIHHDMDDAVRAGVLTEMDVPADIRAVLGSTPGDRLDAFLHDIITSSSDKNDICMTDSVWKAMRDIRTFMFERVYTNPDIKAEEGKAEELVCTLYDYYLHHPDKLPEENRKMADEGEPLERCVCDFVGAMTDRFAILTYNELFVPKSWEMI
ncbi:MAG: deoxyguanosinetriphosphate triphosphohydrolase [Lachnospiraceae bacterium]|nr:deoxyguanosinetriphosphate triphosphohydrolase [Lachnospiraceae bacterium]MBP1584101.1 deoxyguanosinetriphosphate triphosphohydrolase [Lachnospiraceae bacterium]